MGGSIGDLASLDNMLAGMSADVIEQRDPRGTTFYRLVDAIERHAAAESAALGQYHYLAEQSDDPIVALIMRLILEDEERHHTLLTRIATTLRDALNWTYSPNALPESRGTALSASAQADLIAMARALVEEEQTGARALRRLADRGQGLGDGLDELLLDMMAMDSDKHARLLQFVQKRLERQRQ